MKNIINLFAVELERCGWILTLWLLTLSGFIMMLTGILSVDFYFVGQCFVAGVGYLASILKKSKKELLNDNVKKLLTENQNSGSDVSVMKDLDHLTEIFKKSGPMFEQLSIKNIHNTK